jgi:hypothetical protein
MHGAERKMRERLLQQGAELSKYADVAIEVDAGRSSDRSTRLKAAPVRKSY